MLLTSNGVKSICNQIGFDMGGKRIKFESQCNLLGIFRDIKQKVNIEEIMPKKKDSVRIDGCWPAFREWTDKTFMCLLMVYLRDPKSGIWS